MDYEEAWYTLMGQLERDCKLGHAYKSKRALLLMQEFEKKITASNPALEHLRMSVPECYSDAIKRWPWIKCEPHEWDNRSGLENVEYILIESATRLSEKQPDCEECKLGGVAEWLERGYKNCPYCGRMLAAAQPQKG